MIFLTHIKVTISVLLIGAAFIFVTLSGKFEYKQHGDNTEVLLSVDVNKKHILTKQVAESLDRTHN